MTNATSARTPTSSDATTGHDVHPDDGPSMIPNTRPDTAASDSSADSQSSDGGCSSTLVGTNAIVPAAARTASTTLRAKKLFHENHSRSSPDANRPSTAPPPATPTHSPTARPRSSGGNEVVITDSVVGMTNAAPTPITARQAMTTVGSEARAATAAPEPKIARPASSVPLRPYRSPTAPANSSSPANTTV